MKYRSGMGEGGGRFGTILILNIKKSKKLGVQTEREKKGGKGIQISWVSAQQTEELIIKKDSFLVGTWLIIFPEK